MSEDFPIRLDNDVKSIPWAVLSPHEPQALANHGHTLDELAARGGLSPEEAVAIMEDRPFERMPFTQARLRLRDLITGTSTTYGQLVLRLQRSQAKIAAFHRNRPSPGDLEELRTVLADAELTLRALAPRLTR